MCPTVPCPLAPIARKISVELGLEGFFRAPSRPVPKISGGRGEAFFLPAEGEYISCDSPFSAASSGANGLGAAQVWCEQSAVREESPTPEFYRMRADFTRRFSDCDLAISTGISISYRPRIRECIQYSPPTDRAVPRKFSCMKRAQ